jgi:hypothetical protein
LIRRSRGVRAGGSGDRVLLEPAIITGIGRGVGAIVRAVVSTAVVAVVAVVRIAIAAASGERESQ